MASGKWMSRKGNGAESIAYTILLNNKYPLLLERVGMKGINTKKTLVIFSMLRCFQRMPQPLHRIILGAALEQC